MLDFADHKTLCAMSQVSQFFYVVGEDAKRRAKATRKAKRREKKSGPKIDAVAALTIRQFR